MKEVLGALFAGLRIFRRGGTTNAKDNRVDKDSIDLQGRWVSRGTTMQDLYTSGNANSIVRRLDVSAQMGMVFGTGI